ncbi:hypothetical protein ACVWY0_001134 [Arthrobacter sp. UYNi723]
MTLVILESPYAGPTPEAIASNEEYARRAVKDALQRGEAPLASHLLYTQPGILDDTVPEERKTGIDAGHAWLGSADQMVVYADLGISPGMHIGIERAKKLSVPVSYRYLDGPGQ